MSDGRIEIHGTCAPGFEPVRAAFAANFAEPDDPDRTAVQTEHSWEAAPVGARCMSAVERPVWMIKLFDGD